MVKVDIEYCDKCNFKYQCNLVKDFLESNDINTKVSCDVGRRGSFEVKIEGQLVHSKLQSLAFPDQESLLENVERAKKGLPLEKVKEAPIENCSLM